MRTNAPSKHLPPPARHRPEVLTSPYIAGLRARYEAAVRRTLVWGGFISLALGAAVAAISQLPSVGILAAVGAAVLVGWCFSIYAGARKGDLAGAYEAEAILFDAESPGADIAEIERRVSAVRTGNFKNLAVVSCVFGLFIFTPLMVLPVLLGGVFAYFLTIHMGFLGRLSAVSPELVARTGRAMRRSAQEQVRSTAEPLRAVAERGADMAAGAIRKAAQQQPARPPLHVQVDVDNAILELGSHRIPIGDILDANVLQKKGDGVAFEIVSAAGITALGPLGFVLERMAKNAGIGDTRKFALKLTFNDERDPIKVIEVTPDPLPVNSPLCQETRASLEKVVAQLQVIRMRRSQAAT